MTCLQDNIKKITKSRHKADFLFANLDKDVIQ